jgi:hypothetical protein
MTSTESQNAVERRSDTDVLALLTAIDATGAPHLKTDPGVVKLHLVVLNPSEPSGISGWECAVRAEAPIKLVATDFEGKAINVGRETGEYIVGLAEPLPQADTLLLATLTFYVPSPQKASVFFGHVSRPSVDGEMIYAAGHDPGIFTRLKWPAEDRGDEPAFVFNPEPAH